MATPLLEYLWSHIFSYLLEGAAAGFVAILVYMWKKRMDGRGVRYKLATALAAEIATWTSARRSARRGWFGAMGRQAPVAFPRAIYDGLVSSGNIGDFDTDLQKSLHRFYQHMEAKEHWGDEGYVRSISDKVERIRSCNTSYWKRFWSRIRGVLWGRRCGGSRGT